MQQKGVQEEEASEESHQGEEPRLRTETESQWPTGAYQGQVQYLKDYCWNGIVWESFKEYDYLLVLVSFSHCSYNN